MASSISARVRDGCNARQKNCHDPRYHPEVSTRCRRFFTRAIEMHATDDVEIKPAYSPRASDGRLLAPPRRSTTCTSPLALAFSTWVTSVSTRDMDGLFVNHIATGELNLRKMAVFAAKLGAIPLYTENSANLRFPREFQNFRHPKTPKTWANIVSGFAMSGVPSTGLNCFQRIGPFDSEAVLERGQEISCADLIRRRLFSPRFPMPIQSYAEEPRKIAEMNKGTIHDDL
jgi:hypothetical protein